MVLVTLQRCEQRDNTYTIILLKHSRKQQFLDTLFVTIPGRCLQILNSECIPNASYWTSVPDLVVFRVCGQSFLHEAIDVFPTRDRLLGKASETMMLGPSSQVVHAVGTELPSMKADRRDDTSIFKYRTTFRLAGYELQAAPFSKGISCSTC